MSDLFSSPANITPQGYGADQIEVLEGLEPVRKRPGMYIGGTDERALHHLASEILDNAMDEAVAGHANRIEITLEAGNRLTITDNGRGIPVDEHPKFPGKSALEVIMTTLHSGGKFSGKAYATSGGLHGVGISVVNALSSFTRVEVARDKQLYAQEFSRGHTQGGLQSLGAVNNRRGTSVCFIPDTEIFGEKAALRPEWLYQAARSKAYLYRGVEIRWSCDETLVAGTDTPSAANFSFPNGLLDYLNTQLQGEEQITAQPFDALVDFPGDEGKVEIAIAWPDNPALDGFCRSYCNTIPTPQGGSHENGMRTALTRALKNYAEMAGNKKASVITSEDLFSHAAVLISVFIRDPQFQGQTKDKLATASATRLVDTALKDRFELWLSQDTASTDKLVADIQERAEDRIARRKKKDETIRKSATRRTRLPGKLADCSQSSAEGTELFIVEGDSAGGSAKQARNRETQAILPLRGKILNVVSASRDKLMANQEVQDLAQAMGCGLGKKNFDIDDLRYERIIIMTDADVDGAHIASLLVTFFYTQMPGLIEAGHLYLAQPPLYRLAAGGKTAYARDDAHKEELEKTLFKGKSKIDVSRFKGLGEMMPAQLKETTMNPNTRILLRVTLPDASQSDAVGAPALEQVDILVDELMGKNADARFRFIQDRAEFATDLDI